MKASMNDKGKITIKPEGNVERYALREWKDNNNTGDIIIKTKKEKPFKGFSSKKRED